MRFSAQSHWVTVVFITTLSFVAFGESPPRLIEGEYRNIDGRYDLHVKRFDEFFSVDIVAAGHPQSSEGSHFFAVAKGNIAVFSNGDCLVYLKPINSGIELEDHCGGTDAGTYKKSL